MRHRIMLLQIVLFVGALCAAVPAAQGVTWADWSGWSPQATTGQIPFLTGHVDVTISPGVGLKNLVTHEVSRAPGFFDPSSVYSDLHEVPYSALAIKPAGGPFGSTYSATFDFVGTALDGKHAFALGQLMARRRQFDLPTAVLVRAFDAGGVDVTGSLQFHQETAGPAYDAPLTWTPASGVLAPDLAPTLSQSGYALFRAAPDIQVTRIQVMAFAVQNNLIEYGILDPPGTPTQDAIMPEPATMLAVAVATAGLGGYLRRRRKA